MCGISTGPFRLRTTSRSSADPFYSGSVRSHSRRLSDPLRAELNSDICRNMPAYITSSWRGGSATRGSRGLARKYARGPERAGEWAGGRAGMGPGSNPVDPPRLGAVATSEWDASPPSPGPVAGSSSRAEPTGRNPSESRTPEESNAGSSPGSHTPPDSGWPGQVARASHRIRPVRSSEARAREGELHAGRPHPVENSDRRGIP